MKDVDKFLTDYENSANVDKTPKATMMRLVGDTIDREVNVRKLKGGTKLIKPVDLNTVEQTLDSDMVAELWDSKVPEVLSSKVNEIFILDTRNPADSYWEKTYGIPNFKSYATGGRGTINFHASKSHEKGFVRHTLYHEAAHNLDSSMGWYSKTGAWKQVREQDMSLGGREWASDYARSSKAEVEDFADSVADYISNSIVFKSKFPARARKLKELLEGVTG
jgi:hypothetical protein